MSQAPPTLILPITPQDQVNPAVELSSTDSVTTTPAEAQQLEQMALYHAHCDDAAKACWYLCRSLGLARQSEPQEPNLELLFDLLGALADLPPEVSTSPCAEIEDDKSMGVFELCHQLAAARELSQQAWDEAADTQTPACPTAAAQHLH